MIAASLEGGHNLTNLLYVSLQYDTNQEGVSFWKYSIVFKEDRKPSSYVLLMDGRIFPVDEFYPKRK